MKSADHEARLRRADEALSANPDYTSGDGEAREWVTDIVADLLTWAETKGIDIQEVARIAQDHVRAERLERREPDEDWKPLREQLGEAADCEQTAHRDDAPELINDGADGDEGGVDALIDYKKRCHRIEEQARRVTSLWSEGEDVGDAIAALATACEASD